MITEQWKPFDSNDYPHEWKHEFENDISQADRKLWLQQVMEWAQLSGTELVINETANGVELGFKNVEHLTGFVMGTYGTLESEGNHTHIQEFTGSNEPDAYFMKAADAYLTAMGIDYTQKVDGNEVTYEFNNFADRAHFQWLIEHGALDSMAQHLQEVEAFDREYLEVKREVDAAFELHR